MLERVSADGHLEDNSMKPLIRNFLLGLLYAAFSGTVAAAENVEAELAESVSKQFPGSNIEHVAPSPIPGIYEVSVGGELIYVTPDAQFAFVGRLFDLHNQADLSEPVRAQLRVKSLDAVPESQMVIFEPVGGTKYTITTFTDVDCPYCRKMHSEIDQLTAAGVRVRYLLFPRTQVGSPSYLKAVSVWCAEDRNSAMTRAKQGENLEERACPNPVDEHIALAKRLGLTGTPMTITEFGERLNGYVQADQLVARLQAAHVSQSE